MKYFNKKHIIIFGTFIFLFVLSCKSHKQIKSTEICNLNALNIINSQMYNVLDTLIEKRKSDIRCNESYIGFSLVPYQHNDEYGYVISGNTLNDMLFNYVIYGAFFYNDVLFVIYDDTNTSLKNDSITAKIITNSFEKNGCNIIIVNCERYSKYLPNDFSAKIVWYDDYIHVTNCNCSELIMTR